MPIYAYKCESCGHSKDVLQKMSDAPLTECPQCDAPAFKKQLTAAGFQLKGSGSTAVPPVTGGGDAAAAPAADGKAADKSAPAPAPAATPAPVPAATSTPKAS